jgi:hypothetical protein
MAKTYVDQFWLVDPSAANVGDVLELVRYDIVDGDEDGLIASRPGQIIDTIDGKNTLDSYPASITVDLVDGSRVIIDGYTLYPEGGEIIFTPSDGTVLQEGATFVAGTVSDIFERMPVSNLAPTCFARGTYIQTPNGSRSVEDMREGNIVFGHNGKDLTLRKVMRSQFSADDLLADPNLRPVRILAGALGNDLPARDLLVSRQHRMLVSSKISERMFGQNEVLIPAIRLTELPGVFIDEDVNDVEYFHLLFDEHEVIFAEGAPTESLLTGPEALKSLSPEAREEILAIFPQVANMNFTPKPARPVPTGRKQKQLITRHIRTSQPLG